MERVKEREEETEDEEGYEARIPEAAGPWGGRARGGAARRGRVRQDEGDPAAGVRGRPGQRVVRQGHLPAAAHDGGRAELRAAGREGPLPNAKVFPMGPPPVEYYTTDTAQNQNKSVENILVIL